MPSEATLPVQKPAGGGQGAALTEAEDTLLQLSNSEDKRPWLRLQQRAHVDRIRSLSFSPDSQRLFVGGDDKHVIVYARAETGEWNYERKIRWQIQRGDSGRIYDVATSAQLIAFGGRSATGTTGEILLVRAADGQLIQMLQGNEQLRHRDRLTAITMSGTTSPTISSMDQRGRLLHWSRDPQSGVWSARLLADDPTNSAQLLTSRTLHPIAALDPERTVAPVFKGNTPQGVPKWAIRAYETRQPKRSRDLLSGNNAHYGMVTAMNASANGRRLATADVYFTASGESGQLFLWDLSKSDDPAKVKLTGFATALSFDGNGQLLAIGKSGASRGIELRDVRDESNRTVLSLSVPKDVWSCELSPDGAVLAYSQGAQVVIKDLRQNVNNDAVIQPSVPAPKQVAFSKSAPYRIAISSAGNRDAFESVFEPNKGQLDPSPTKPSDWRSAVTDAGGWSIERDGQTTWLVENGQRRGTIPLNPQLQGTFRTACWIARDNRPFAVAVGTFATEIYVYQIADAGNCPLLRKFRGHTGSVTGMCVSHDGKYLASCATDRTVRIWPLAELGRSVAIDRWGASFQPQDDRLVVSSVREDGPLYFRGIRSGDQINSLVWIDTESNPQSAANRQAIIDRLATGPTEQLTAFEFQRGLAPISTFQSYPAWQPLATLIVDENREWAFWTPAGYYDASFEGHKLFGWQVNRGVNSLPDFFLAAQVRRALERPKVMSNLLSSGSLKAAFDEAGEDVAANWSSILSQLQLLRPKVEIIRPVPGTVVRAGKAAVEVKVATKKGQALVPPKAFANGVVASGRRLVKRQEDGSTINHHFEFDLPVPSDPNVLIQVFAATEDEAADVGTVLVRNESRKRARPKMFVVTAGVNDYADAQVPKLEFAEANALTVAAAMEEHASTLYDCEAITLLNNRVTKATWEATLEAQASILHEEATADDLLVVFLSGHGVRDDDTGRYYFVPSDAKLADIRAGRYGDCLSFDDLAAFSGVSCRKLIVLDTCHSGAIQPLRQSELKSALRALQDDVFLTLTASEGGQEAVEDAGRQQGRFTFRFVEALNGIADGNGGDADGIVSLAETIRYVKRMVQADSANDSTLQYPMAGPSELLELTEIPITTTSAPSTL